MEWREEALVLGIRRHGETSVVAEVMTRARGRHLGLVRGGRSRRMQPVLQPGNLVEATWRARLDEHMGTFVIEPVEFRTARLIEDRLALSAIQHLSALLHILAEREPHPRLYDAVLAILATLAEPPLLGALMLRFEAGLLDELGFGLDLERCALTGSREGLAFVSPKSGRAVTADAGAPWSDRLLPLPALLVAGIADGSDLRSDLAAGFRLTGHFLERHLWEPRAIDPPPARETFVSGLLRSLDATPGSNA